MDYSMLCYPSLATQFPIFCPNIFLTIVNISTHFFQIHLHLQNSRPQMLFLKETEAKTSSPMLRLPIVCMPMSATMSPVVIHLQISACSINRQNVVKGRAAILFSHLHVFVVNNGTISL